MLRRLCFVLLVLAMPGSALAGPREEAEAVFQRFLTAFTAAQVDGILDLFWPDALFFGTGMAELGTTPSAIASYFEPMRRRRPDERQATAIRLTSLEVSDSVALVSGLWQAASVVNGQPRATPLRVSLAVTRRGDQWRIAQFHNSARP